MKNISKSRITLHIVCLIIVIWALSLLKCEILTTLYKNEFKNTKVSVQILGDTEYCKILKYSKTKAIVYYISDNRSRGDIITYANQDGIWNFDSWDTVWSVNGNADNTIWPYFWHFFYSHPYINRPRVSA